MTPHELSLLRDIHGAGTGIMQRTRGLTPGEYAADRDLQLTVERLFTILGEAASRLHRQYPVTAARVLELRGPIAFRNFLIHVYDQIDQGKVWDIVQTHVPPMVASVELLLREGEEEQHT